jgi:pimeloyl-ACP methyl ester carboxylesterase
MKGSIWKMILQRAVGVLPAANESRYQSNLAFTALLLVVIWTGGCATAVGVQRVDTREAHRLLTANALSSGTPSAHSLQVLSRLDLVEQFEDEPEAALAALHVGFLTTGEEDRLFALAELSFLHAEQRRKHRAMQRQLCRTQKGSTCPSESSREQRAEKDEDRAYYLAAAVYAYAFLFPEEPQSASLDPADPRLRLAYDLYNRGLTEGLSAADAKEVVLASGRHTLPFGTLDIKFVSTDFSWAGYQLEHFVPAANLAVRGLRNRYRRPGVGAPLAASLAGTETVLGPGSNRIPLRLKVPVTTFLRLDHPRAQLRSTVLHGQLELYAPGLVETVLVDGHPRPLEFEPTVALAYTLESTGVYELEIAGFLRETLRNFIPQSRTQDGLFFMQPPSVDRIPLVLVHGTASSPARWAELVNELSVDPRLRPHYQIWLFLYDTGNPIGFSAGRLRQALENVVHELDPEGKAPALQQMVVMGHSQGGLLTKLTAIDSGTRFWDDISTTPLDQLTIEPETKELLQRSLFFTPLPFVKRVIFISTPHRGSYQAALRLGRLSSWLVSLPGDLTTRTLNVITQNQDKLLVQKLEKLPTSVDNMNPSSPFIKTLASIPVAEGVNAHSIIPVLGDGPIQTGGDGIVKYESAHIDGVASELVVRFGHSVQSHPKTIEEVRRILLAHLSTQ